MTDTTADDELDAFRSDYRRLLELTGTADVPSGLQPQFVARMLKRSPSALVELHELHERAGDPRAGRERLAEEIRRHHAELLDLLSAAEEMDEPGGVVQPFGRTDPAEECGRFADDVERLASMCAAVDESDPDSVLIGLGARRADLLALQVLADRIDAGGDPADLVEDVADRRTLLDDLSARALDALPDHATAAARATADDDAAVDSAPEADAHSAHLESLAFQDSYDWLLELTDCGGLDRTTELQELSRRLGVPLDRVVAVRTLYDDVSAPGTDPGPHLGRLRASRDLLDDLLTRAEDVAPGEVRLAPVVELDSVRARHGAGVRVAGAPEAPPDDHVTGALARRIEARTGLEPDGGQSGDGPVISHSPGPDGDGRTPDDECDEYVAVFGELCRQTGTAALEPSTQAEALNDLLGVPVGDAAALRLLADRIDARFAPRRVLAGEARARRPQLDRLAADATAVTPLPPAVAEPPPDEDAAPTDTEPTPIEQADEDAAPTDTEPAPIEQADTEPAPVEPATIEPTDAAPAPVVPATIEPTDAEPAPVEQARGDTAVDPRMAEFRRMRAVRDEQAIGATVPGAGDGRAPRRTGVMAAMSPSRRVAVVVVALIVVVDLVVIGWWLLARSGDGDDSGVEEDATDPSGQTIDGPGLGRGLSALGGAPGSEADVIASMDDGACHLVALGSFPTLSGARDFASDPATPELLADRSRVVPSTALPGFGPDGYVVVALGENPGDAARLADVASDTGLEVTPPTSLERACPAAAT